MSGESSVVKLEPTKPEAEIAADLKARLEVALEPVAKLMDEAAALGLIGWDTITPTAPYFRHKPNGIKVIKVL